MQRSLFLSLFVSFFSSPVFSSIFPEKPNWEAQKVNAYTKEKTTYSSTCHGHFYKSGKQSLDLFDRNYFVEAYDIPFGVVEVEEYPQKSIVFRNLSNKGPSKTELFKLNYREIEKGFNGSGDITEFFAYGDKRKLSVVTSSEGGYFNFSYWLNPNFQTLIMYTCE